MWPHSVTATVPPLPSPVPLGSRHNVHCLSGKSSASSDKYVFGVSYDAALLRMIFSSAESGGVGGGERGNIEVSRGPADSLVSIGCVDVSAIVELDGKKRYSTGKSINDARGSKDADS